MSHGHKHADNRHEPPHAEPVHHKGVGKKWHRDWRIVLAAIVMLVAMLTYVFTIDDSMWPGRHPSKTNQPTRPVPVALP